MKDERRFFAIVAVLMVATVIGFSNLAQKAEQGKT